MESWLAGLIEWGPVRSWPRAASYAIAIDRELGEVLRWEEPKQTVFLDLTAVNVATKLGAWGTPAQPPRTDSLVRLANEVGLTAGWERTTRPLASLGYSIWFGRRGGLRPAHQMLLADFRRDVQRVRDVLEAYRVGFSQAEERGPADEEATKARSRFWRVMAPFGNRVLGELVTWLPSNAQDPFTPAGFKWKGWPSLMDLAYGQVLAMYQDHTAVKRCALAECGKPFIRQEPRTGQTGKAWDRPDAAYCSKRHQQRDWYLRRKG
jgi:hypothetical protein